MKYLQNWKYVLVLALLLLAVLGAVTPAYAQQGGDYLIEYDVPGAPRNVAVEAPGRIWYTLPAEGKIGILLPNGDSATTETWPDTPDNGSAPEDLAVRQGTVWFTDPGLNRIGAFDIASENFTFYPVPTPDSEPTDLAVMPNGLIWFIARATASLTVLDPAANGGSGQFTPYPYPQSNAQLGDLVALGNDTIWLTATNRNEIAAFNRLAASYEIEQTSGPGGIPAVDNPFGITVDSAGRPWMTVLGAANSPSAIASYAPATTFRVRTTPTGTPNAEPARIAYRNAGRIWYLFYSENAVGKLARLVILPNGGIGGTVEASLGNDAAAPWGVAVDGEGQAWFAVAGNGTIAGWRPPYSDWGATLLPIVRTNN